MRQKWHCSLKMEEKEQSSPKSRATSWNHIVRARCRGGQESAAPFPSLAQVLTCVGGIATRVGSLQKPPLAESLAVERVGAIRVSCLAARAAGQRCREPEASHAARG